MTNEEFKKTLTEFKYYLKPALFAVLSGNADIFSEETKIEIIQKLKEADAQVQEIHDYQEKRNTVLKRGLEKVEGLYKSIKIKFQNEGVAEQATELAKADKLISNL